jgi:hypothetical protein
VDYVAYLDVHYLNQLVLTLLFSIHMSQLAAPYPTSKGGEIINLVSAVRAKQTKINTFDIRNGSSS